VQPDGCELADYGARVMVDVGGGAALAGVLRADVDRIRWNAAAAQQCGEAAAGVRGVGRLDDGMPAYGQDTGQFCLP
jgi:hypothetical protein